MSCRGRDSYDLNSIFCICRFIRPQFFENNPLFSFIQYVVGPYTDDLGNVLPYAVEGLGVPVDPLAFAGLLGWSPAFLCIPFFFGESVIHLELTFFWSVHTDLPQEIQHFFFFCILCTECFPEPPFCLYLLRKYNKRDSCDRRHIKKYY